ncbi:FixH family protein [Brevibacillus sp. AY1]|uniref:FixH family protein n=1 Tax=Brevibacillus sp. AY1 TaxID=2807621 RepID=UPI002453CAED|nr:FixH family protein [Brevibacillus sp. AY1]MDH4615588.1 FixH family protein [Brevibacillus sp. AY1]
MILRRLIYTLPCLLLLTAVTACGNDQQQTAILPSTPVDAAFTMEPSQPAAGDTVTFAVTVTQEGQPVDDASEVKFEWWKEGQEPHAMLPATFQKDGLYIAKQPITEPGSYFVYYHVTARDFHTMKKIPFTVTGEGNTTTPETSPPSPDETTAGTPHEHGTNPSAGGQVELHFMPPKEVRAAEVAWLGVHVMQENEVIEKATVRLEYWLGSDEKHAFLDTTESHPGQYGAKIAFPTSGTYTVKVHVEKGEIHDHKDFTLSVQ